MVDDGIGTFIILMFGLAAIKINEKLKDNQKRKKLNHIDENMIEWK